MKRILYITNIQAPYRERFFEEFAKTCKLTVLYERKESSNRDESWVSRGETNYKKVYLNGRNIGKENGFSLKILKYIFGKYDYIIVGCYNSPVQMFAIVMMRLFRVSYMLNTDGELFIERSGLKSGIKKFFLHGAKKYLVPGEKVAESLAQIVRADCIEIYYFSSLSQAELEAHQNERCERRNKVLVIGQYYDYKGMDIAVQVAKKDESIKYIFIGMGKRAELFVKEQRLEEVPNIEVVPFLDKKSLEKEYKTCTMLVLPSRKECWGLVINEAASYGTPIVSTWGSGAAVEFLSDQYPQYLAEPGNVEDLYLKIVQLIHEKGINDYCEFLLKKSQRYSIEKSVKVHNSICGIEL